jgi:hypothetical protein
MGKAVEHLIASTCVLGSGGVLNAWTSIVDDEGVDLVLQRRNSPETLALQVKSRLTTAKGIAEKQLFHTQVRKATLEPRRELHMFFVIVDPKAVSIETVWIVPSLEFVEHAPLSPHEKYKFVSSAKANSKNKWSGYRVAPDEVPQRLLGLVEGLAPS